MKSIEFLHALRPCIGPSRDLAVAALAEVTTALQGPRRYRIANIGADACNVVMSVAASLREVETTDMLLVPNDSIDVWVGVLGNTDPYKDGPSVIRARCFAPAATATLRITEVSRG
jgi:hypothetical protein